MIALLLASCLVGPAAQDEDEPVDLFQWARQLEALDLTWSWGDFAFAFGGEADLEFFVFGKEAPGIHVEDPAIRSDRYVRGKYADSPEAVGRLQAVLDMTFRDWLEGSVEGRVDGTTALDGVAGARIEQAWLRARIPGTPEAALQAGKFAPPIGNFIPRSAPRKNPMATWPLPYDHITTLASPGDAPAVLQNRRDDPDVKDWYVPIWQAVYTEGLMGSGTWKDLSYSVAVMNSAPGTLPFEWDREFGNLRFSNVYLHLSYVLDITTRVGATASWGPYEKVDYGAGDPEDFQQTLVGFEAEFMTGFLEVYGELFWTRFETYLSGNLDLCSWYVEAKYAITPALFGAVRVAQMYFLDPSWDRDVSRFEVGGGWFFTSNFFVKATGQFNVHMGGREPSDNMLMVQLGLGF